MKEFIRKNKKEIKIVSICLIISFTILFFCSKNSPFYPFNDWVDENAFFTVGKSWKYGVIPYKDIFEQKGPFLYFLFMLASFISNKTFLGVFFLEIIAFTITLYFITKIARLFLKENYIYSIIILFGSIIASSTRFVHGGSSEELFMSLLSISMYYFLKYFKTKEITNKELIINGVLAGIISMSKFNLLGFWFSFIFFIFLSMVFAKNIKKSIISCLYFLLGMIIPILIFSIYFILVGGFNDFINTYFLFNITNYGENTPVLNRLRPIYNSFYSQLNSSILLFTLIIVGIIYFMYNKKIIKDKLFSVALPFSFGITALGIYWNAFPFTYYFLFLEFYIMFGLIAFLKETFENNKIKSYKIILIVSILLSTLLITRNDNLYYHKYKKSNLVQYKFAKVINKKKNATLLYYGNLDGGFYTTTGIVPNTKYFESQNAVVPGLDETLKREIKNKKFDFIVVRNNIDQGLNILELNDNYKVIKIEKSKYENNLYNYYLYEKK